MKENAVFVIEKFKLKTTTLINKVVKIGRNNFVKVKYKNGVILEIKYKKVENDILNGECALLTD